MYPLEKKAFSGPQMTDQGSRVGGSRNSLRLYLACHFTCHRRCSRRSCCCYCRHRVKFSVDVVEVVVVTITGLSWPRLTLKMSSLSMAVLSQIARQVLRREQVSLRNFLQTLIVQSPQSQREQERDKSLALLWISCFFSGLEL